LSHAGRPLLTVSPGILSFSVQIGKPLTGHTGDVYSLAFSPDGKTLARFTGRLIIQSRPSDSTQIEEKRGTHVGGTRRGGKLQIGVSGSGLPLGVCASAGEIAGPARVLCNV
jgi:WD40 repeat protein